MLRKIYGCIQNEDGPWRIRINHELDCLINGADIVRAQELDLDGSCTTSGWRKSHTDNYVLEASRETNKGKPQDIRIMGVTGWIRTVSERTE